MKNLARIDVTDVHSTILDGFVRATQLYPDNTALIIDDVSWSYNRISNMARKWASALVSVSKTQNLKRIGVLGNKSETSYIGTLTSLFVGAAFVPLNPNYPVARSVAMLEAADLDALIVGDEAFDYYLEMSDRAEKLPPTLFPGLSTSFHSNIFMGKEVIETFPVIDIPRSAQSDDLAYLLFTSGSTGKPKGVPISHGNVVAFINENQKRYQIHPSDRLSQTFDQTFDLSVFDLFMAWTNGACVCSMHPEDLLSPFASIKRHKISVWFSVPSVASLIHKQHLLKKGCLKSLRLSLFCGEGLPKEIACAWQKAASNSIVENLYGPTELTIACSVYRWNNQTSPKECVNEIVPIGFLYDKHSAVLIDPDLNPVLEGEIGELCVTGPQMFNGYWRAPHLTEDHFIEFRDEEGITSGKYYRTGDRVKRNKRGAYVHLGRIDSQVKIGGNRIELGEIEAALRKEGAKDAAIIPYPNNFPIGLCAFLTGKQSRLENVTESLRQYLPKYMIPNTVVMLSKMPLNVNGKIDRVKLREHVTRTKLSGPNKKLPIEVDIIDMPDKFLSNNLVPVGSDASSQHDNFRLVIANALGLKIEQITDDLKYQDLSQWDSLQHVSLMLAIEKALDLEIGLFERTNLVNVAAIREFFKSHASNNHNNTNIELHSKPKLGNIHRGLEGVIFDKSSITNIDGENGVLEVRGYSIHELATNASFEEMAYLLLNKELPSPKEKLKFVTEMEQTRCIPSEVESAMVALSNSHPMTAIRIGVSMLECYDSNSPSNEPSLESSKYRGLRLISQIPLLFASHYKARSNRKVIEFPEGLSHAEWIYHLLCDCVPNEEIHCLINRDLVLHADHSANASTFTSRIVTSCNASMHASISAALATFEGDLHGGAAELVMLQVDEVGSPENVYDFVAEKIKQKKPIMGFGHRVYRTEDPRVKYIRDAAFKLSKTSSCKIDYEIIESLVEAMKPYSRHGIAPNVDLYSGLFYRLLGLPNILSVPMFAAGRIAGWVAHVLEQKENNVLIRPRLQYNGETNRKYFPK